MAIIRKDSETSFAFPDFVVVVVVLTFNLFCCFNFQVMFLVPIILHLPRQNATH